MQLSDHFTLAEMACRCGCGGESKPDILANLKRTAAMLEVVRNACGNKPITVNDAYRCQDHNRAVGGEPQSFHMRGMAADITVEGLPSSKVQAIARKIIPVGGLGSYSTFTHVDIRPRIRGDQTTWSK